MVLSYLSLYQASFFCLPLEREGGIVLTHEEVVDQLDRDTVAYDISLGFDGLFAQMLRVSLKVETERYEEAVFWLRDLIYKSRFDASRFGVSKLCTVLFMLFFCYAGLA